MDCDVAIIGAGPAGMAAAVAAADTGVSVCVLDLAERVGGQYWRWGPATADGRYHRGWKQFVALRDRFDTHDRITFLAGHAVFALEPGRPWHLAALAGERTRSLVTVTARRVVVATGAYDCQLPIPGWTLPGVMAAGAAQALLKGSDTLAGERVVVAGTGPLLLALAADLLRAGATVVAVAEANDPVGYLAHPRALAASWRRLLEAVDYLQVLARHRVPVLRRHAVVAAHGDDRLRQVTLAQIDPSWRIVAGSQRRLDAEVLACGYGFLPQLELLTGAGATLRTGALAPMVVVDAQQQTSVVGLFAAGETTGVGGAELAVIEGEIAGTAAAAPLGEGVRGCRPRGSGTASSGLLVGRGVRRTGGLRRFATVMEELHRVNPGWTGWAEPATIVCRCEEVTVEEIRAAQALGADDVRSVKMLARAGMGWCQGRMCGHSVRALVGGTEPAPNRPLAQPVPLGVLAELGDT